MHAAFLGAHVQQVTGLIGMSGSREACERRQLRPWHCCKALVPPRCLQTAEMPGFYQSGEYDVAGFAVGSVKQDRVIDGSQIQEGDVVLGMESSGVHSNGFSLVRKVLEVSANAHDVAWHHAGKRNASRVAGCRLSAGLQWGTADV